MPNILVKDNSQKGGYKYSDILTPNILADICRLTTGTNEYTVTFDDEGYNKGRLVVIEHNNSVIYVSLSEHDAVTSRNSFFQSLTTAFTSYNADPRPNKRIAFYFMPNMVGSVETEYFRFMYRLMATNGVAFINARTFLTHSIVAFQSADDIIAARRINRDRNSSNNSTYITRGAHNTIQIYGKTYGASKKETVLLCLAVARLANNVELYEICENDLTELPAPDLEAIRQFRNVNIIPTNRTMERRLFDANPNYRSPMFTYNLFEKCGDKECAFCNCKISEIIEGAHIWSVASIRRTERLSIEERLENALNGNNGLWLCQNHHKMFDENLITLTENGIIVYSQQLSETYRTFIEQTTTKRQIAREFVTPEFSSFVRLRAAN